MRVRNQSFTEKMKNEAKQEVSKQREVLQKYVSFEVS